MALADEQPAARPQQRGNDLPPAANIGEPADRVDARVHEVEPLPAEHICRRAELGDDELRTTFSLGSLEDLYSAEQQLVKALPEMAGAATSPDLRQAFMDHLEQTRHHVTRLEEVFVDAGIPRKAEHCEAMEGLIKEGSEIASATGDPAAKDVALIAAREIGCGVA